MAKSRNTTAKPARPASPRKPAEKPTPARQDKAERRPQKKSAAAMAESVRDPSGLSDAERSVLSVFRKFLMGQGQMLCFDGAMLETYRAPLVNLVQRGFVVAERFRGAYSLTETGFAAMREKK